MKTVRLAVSFIVLLAVCLAVPSAAAAQSVVPADIQRLQDNAAEASRDIAALRGRDASLAAELERELDDLRDDTVYLKVKLRRNEPIARSEYLDLRDRIDTVHTRARGDAAERAPQLAPPPTGGIASPAPAATARPAAPSSSQDIPVGTEFDVRLQNPLSSETAQVEDRFEATTLVDLGSGDRVIVPAGSVVRGMVTSVSKATRTDRKGSVTVVFDRITIKGKNYPIKGTVSEALESEGIKGEAGKIGAGAGVGAILGGILGGVKGAIAGILIGGGGTIAATEGKDVNLPPGTTLRVRLDSGLNIR